MASPASPTFGREPVMLMFIQSGGLAAIELRYAAVALRCKAHDPCAGPINVYRLEPAVPRSSELLVAILPKQPSSMSLAGRTRARFAQARLAVMTEQTHR